MFDRLQLVRRMSAKTDHCDKVASEESDLDSLADEQEWPKDLSYISSTLNSSLQSKNTAEQIDGKMDLVLKWSTRCDLIAILGEYSAILHGKAADDEQAILDKTNKLLQTLAGLPMRLKEKIEDVFEEEIEEKIKKRIKKKFEEKVERKVEDSWFEENIEKIREDIEELREKMKKKIKAWNKKSNNVGQKSKATGDLLLDLKWQIRSKIIETLTTNQSFAIFNYRYISSENKTGLIRENNDLVQMLLAMPVRLVDREIVDYYLFAKESEE